MIESNFRCTGCGVCGILCPARAIQMRESGEGFLYPAIEKSKCSQCGLCDRRCHLNRDDVNPVCTRAYAAAAQDARLLEKSASGGVFGTIAKWFLDQGGAVAGCAYGAGLKPRHLLIASRGDLPQMQGSKYVESDLEDVFRQTEGALKSGRSVFFSGTACQIAALRACLDADYENLYTMDLICHGVPSRRLFLEYVKMLGRGREVVDFRFRSKARSGWGGYQYEYRLGRNTTKSGGYSRDFYCQSFLNAQNYRESCYACKYANLNRPGDITVGDYWGVQKIHPQMNPRGGISLLLVNTEKGGRLVAHGDLGLALVETDIRAAVKWQRNLRAPTERPAKRDRFYDDLAAEGLKRTVRKWRTRRLLRQILSLSPPLYEWLRAKAARKQAENSR